MIAHEFLGTLPQWLTLGGVGTILGIILTHRRGMKKLAVEAQRVKVTDRADARDHIAEEMAALRNNIASLREELHNCEEECREKIKALDEQLWGEKKQRVAEQISLINLILKSVDAPELKTLLRSLEVVQTMVIKRT